MFFKVQHRNPFRDKIFMKLGLYIFYISLDVISHLSLQKYYVSSQGSAQTPLGYMSYMI